MKIVTRKDGADRTMEFHGRLEAHTAEEATQHVQAEMEEIEGDLILDLAGLEFISSAGLRMLLVAYRTMLERRGTLKIINVQPFVQHVFELCRLSHLLSTGDPFTVRIWGSRGSLPAPLSPGEAEGKLLSALRSATPEDIAGEDAIQKFVAKCGPLARGTAGGNTACVEVRVGHREIILDAGSGLRLLGKGLMAEGFGAGTGRAVILLSHTHWDHIMGFPFFGPAYVPGNRIDIWGGHEDLEDRLCGQQDPRYFPVALSDMGADIRCRVVGVGTTQDIEGVSLRVAKMDHPGDSFCYRLEYDGKSLVYATDVEVRPETVDDHVEFFADADLLIFDSQYSLEESVAKQDWGHSSPVVGADIAAAAGVKQFLMFHHEPTATDERLQRSLSSTREYIAHTSPDCGCAIDIAWEGMELTL